MTSEYLILIKQPKKYNYSPIIWCVFIKLRSDTVKSSLAKNRKQNFRFSVRLLSRSLRPAPYVVSRGMERVCEFTYNFQFNQLYSF